MTVEFIVIGPKLHPGGHRDHDMPDVGKGLQKALQKSTGVFDVLHDVKQQNGSNPLPDSRWKLRGIHSNRDAILKARPDLGMTQFNTTAVDPDATKMID